MPEHTKEPWRVGRLTHPRDWEEVKETVGPHQVVVDGPNWPMVIADCNVALPDDARQNARRIVACVNACAGIPTEELESSGTIAVECQDEMQAELLKALKQRDDLLAACRAALNHCDRETTYMLEAAIAAMEQQKGGA